jgi:hypothetical protein
MGEGVASCVDHLTHPAQPATGRQPRATGSHAGRRRPSPRRLSVSADTEYVPAGPHAGTSAPHVLYRLKDSTNCFRDEPGAIVTLQPATLAARSRRFHRSGPPGIGPSGCHAPQESLRCERCSRSCCTVYAQTTAKPPMMSTKDRVQLTWPISAAPAGADIHRPFVYRPTVTWKPKHTNVDNAHHQPHRPTLTP